MSNLYSDQSIAIDDNSITIFNYYFPLGAPKKILLKDILCVSTLKLTILSGKYRAWGMGLRPYWFNMGHRVDKDTALLIDTGKFIKAAITPDSPNEVVKILTQLGIKLKE